MNLSDGVRVLALTAVCYLLTFSYETGYFRYFELPTELINISIKNIITVGVGFITFTFLCIVPFANMISQVLYQKNKENSISKLNIGLILYAVITIIYILFISIFHHVMSTLSILLQVVFILSLAANDILIPFIFRRGRSLSDSMDDHAREQAKSNILNIFAKVTKSDLHIYIILFLISMSLAHLWGGLNAKMSALDLTCNGQIIYETQDSSVIVKISKNKFKVEALDGCILEKIER